MISTVYYLKTLVSLGAILSVLYIILKVSKSYFKHQYTGEMKILDRLQIDQQAAILIIQVRNENYLISLANKQVQVIEKLPL